MNLFSRLFRKAPPPPPTLESRIADLERQPDAVITGIALSNDATALRAEAVKKLRYGEALLSLALDARTQTARSDTARSNTEGAVRQAAQQRLAQLLDAGATDFTKIWERAGDKVHALAVAALSTEPQRLEQAVAASQDQEFLQRLVTAAPTARLRQAAAESVRDPARLKQLLKEMRGKDKNVYKIIKRKWDEIQQQQKEQAELQATISTLCDAIERHARKPFDPLFTATLEHLSKQWSNVAAEAPPQLAGRASTAIEIARETITKHLQLLAKQAAHAGAVANAEAEQQAVLRDLRQLLASLYALTVEELPAAQERIQAQLAQHLERWQHAVPYQPATRADSTAFEELTAAIPTLLAALTDNGTLQQQIEQLRHPDTLGEASQQQSLEQSLVPARLAVGIELPLVDEAQRAIAEVRQTLQRNESQQAEQLRELGLLIRKANGALNAGRSAQASRMRSSIDQLVLELPPLTAALTVQLQRLDERLAVLRDWQDYAVAPKRAEMIRQMEELIGSQEEPPTLADQIQKLQAEWKSVSRGSAGQDDAEWRRFHEAAQAAYQPCREYFDTQAQVREENLAKRVELLERLTEFDRSYSWSDADWRYVAQVLREARQEWRTYSPTERAATKPVQEQFSAMLNQIQGRLDAQLARNVERKKNLIAQAGKLRDETDMARAVDELKQLQVAWKAVGLTPRQEDQALWEQFRANADAIHGRRQQQHEQQRSELDGNYAKAVALCEQAEALASLTGAEVFEAAKTVAQLREQLLSIDRLPGNSAQALENRLQQASNRIESNLERYRQQQEEHRWSALLEAGNLLRLWRLAVQVGSAATEAHQSAREFIESPRQWPKGALQQLQSELARSAEGDPAIHEQALRLLCVRAEILTNLTTPIEDQALRRNYQLERLVAGALQSSDSTREQLDALLFAWVSVGATHTEVYDKLLARMQHCRGAAGSSMAA
jgi:hypothetical protein